MIAVPHEVTTAWHAPPIEAVFSRVRSTPSGLSGAEAARRLAEHGPNELLAAHRISPWTILFEQFKNVLIVILLVATALSAFLGHGIEAIAIAVIVLLAVLLGFVQEYRAERAIEALRQMAAPTASALRDGPEVEIPARDLVPGDVVLLRAGNKIPADVRLIEAVNLQVEEAGLTGKSVPVEKHTAPLAIPALKELTGIDLAADLPRPDVRNLSGWVAAHLAYWYGRIADNRFSRPRSASGREKRMPSDIAGQGE